jgi:hypothetical protein
MSSESESYITTDGQSASLPWNKAPIWGLRPEFYTVRHMRVCWRGALSLMRGGVCRLQLLLTIASAVILGSESRGASTIFYCLRFETSLSVSYDSQGYGGSIRPRNTGLNVVSLCLYIFLCVYVCKYADMCVCMYVHRLCAPRWLLNGRTSVIVYSAIKSFSHQKSVPH